MLTAGLFGKLPAHGDFVQRGWDAATVAALDEWLTAGIAAERAAHDDEAFAARMTAAPLWQAYLPPGWAGPSALHIALTPSIDRAGRYFLLTAGVAGGADTVWAAATSHPEFAAEVEASVYAALGGEADADTLLARLAEAAPLPDARAQLLAGETAPQTALWWLEPAEGAPFSVRAAHAEADLLARLISGSVQ